LALLFFRLTARGPAPPFLCAPFGKQRLARAQESSRQITSDRRALRTHMEGNDSTFFQTTTCYAIRRGRERRKKRARAAFLIPRAGERGRAAAVAGSLVPPRGARCNQIVPFSSTYDKQGVSLAPEIPTNTHVRARAHTLKQFPPSSGRAHKTGAPPLSLSLLLLRLTRPATMSGEGGGGRRGGRRGISLLVRNLPHNARLVLRTTRDAKRASCRRRRRRRAPPVFSAAAAAVRSLTPSPPPAPCPR